ncbi:MAG: magnesium transporter CorA family protein [Lachnospiraceae bacterium]|jgi:magnesium transporter|nr:magnesium transporter CorA family protein [Lachnospiraceae bacterium]MEE3461415.1 magnesium transporter CorA family protein [Lachnospiraceae bacterium]
MLRIYRTDDQKLHTEVKMDPGCWINLVDPTTDEAEDVADALDLDVHDVLAARDEEESSRIELEDNYTLILVDIPTPETIHGKESYTTIPMGIILTQEHIVTVCTVETPVLQPFLDGRVREFSTKKKLRFVYQILFRIATLYQVNLRLIDKKRTALEEKIGHEDVDLLDLHTLESTLVYFATSLRANDAVLDRLTRYKRLEQYDEDKELLDDIIIENKQAIEMTTIYRDILSGTRELLSSVIDKKMNNVIKYLTSITLVLGIPNIISGFYGMNVNSASVPLGSSTHGFITVVLFTTLVCLVTFLVLKRKKML